MCGLFGHTSVSDDRLPRSRAALHSLTHRGPDQWGEWYDQAVYIGHRRLSIIDLSEAGRQPMVDDDESVVTCVNGEIYNFASIRKTLSKKYRFKSSSDSEVLVWGYKEWGIDGLLERLDGMYAFVVYDRGRNTLYLARDRMGIKPLYYSALHGEFAWASELKAIEQFYSSREIGYDNTALYDFLTYLYIPSPKTMYSCVFKLEPAHYAEIDLSSRRVNLRKYWSLEVNQRDMVIDDAAEELRGLVRASVREQMVSDVEVGFFLSGGLDSSIVVASADEEQRQSCTAYCIGIAAGSYDETKYAKLIADQYGVRLKAREVSPEDIVGLFPLLIQWYDEPFADTSAFPTYCVSRFAREQLKVVLTGDGGDEVFGGYRWYAEFSKRPVLSGNYRNIIWSFVHAMKMRYRGSLIGKIMNRVEYNVLGQGFPLYAKLLGGMLGEEKARYRECWKIPRDYDDYWSFRRYYRPDLPLFTRLQYLDFHTYLPDDILTKVDRASMAVSLEARVPLLGKELVEFCFSLSEAVRLPNAEPKGLVRYAYRGELPKAILQRPKRGFSIPWSRWRPEPTGKGLKKQEQILHSLYKPLLAQS